jgi:hypothetical protein
MSQDGDVECCWEESVSTHIRVACLPFRKHEPLYCHSVAQVAILVDLVSVLVSAFLVDLVEVHHCLCVISVSGNSVMYHLGMEGSRPVDDADA